MDFFYGLFAGLILLFGLRPHWGSVFTQDMDVQALGKSQSESESKSKGSVRSRVRIMEWMRISIWM